MQHWRVWCSFSTKVWTIGVLWHGYLVPFHHLPPVSQEPWEFPSCALGSVRVLALRDEVSKILQKGAVELVNQSGPGFYSRLFLVKKATRCWQPVINLSTLNGFVTLTKFQMETVASVLGLIRRGGLDVLHGPQIRLLPDPQPFRLPSLSLVCSRGSGLPVLGPVLQSVHSSSGFHHGLILGIGVGALAGVRLLRYLDDWLIVAESLPLLLHHRDLVLQLC